MDKQQSDHIEHRIRQAAENFDPPFNEEAWKKMEDLLDKDKGRRRGIVWWWYGLVVCLIIGSGILFYQYKGSGIDKTDEANNRSRTQIETRKDKNKEAITNKNKPKLQTGETVSKTQKQKTKSETTLPPEDLTINEPEDKKNVPGNSLKNLVSGKVRTVVNRNRNGKPATSREASYKTSESTSFKGVKKDQLHVDNRGVGKENDKTPETSKANMPLPQGDSLTATDNRNDVLKKNDVVVKTPPQTTTTADSSVNKNQLSEKSKSPKATPAVAQPGLYFTASFASDGSNVGKFTLKNREPVYGIGVGYRFNNRISLQTGFYAGRKIYAAGPADYKAKPNSYIASMKILKIDADCYIYELPLSFRYDVIAHKNFRAYATGGLSSFIMKRESYKYHLTGSMGYVSKDSTYRSNKNFFSSAGFSIGFEQKLFSSIYIQAEPYIRVPISGVGEGKVKLYSAGLQVGIKYQPLKRKKK